MDIGIIDKENLTDEQLAVYKAKYRAGKKHLKYIEDTMKHFKFPERRVKCFDTIQYEREVPEIEALLKSKGLL